MKKFLTLVMFCFAASSCVAMEREAREYNAWQTECLLSLLCSKDDAVAGDVFTRLNLGADPNARLEMKGSCTATEHEYRGYTPLAIAASKVHMGVARCRAIVKELLGRIDLDVNKTIEYRCERSGVTPLIIAANAGNFEVCEMLSDDVRINLDQQCSSNGYTALHAACRQGQVKIVELLIGAGANPNLQSNHYFNTPLLLTVGMHIFNEEKVLELTKALCASPIINIDIRNKDCQDAIEIASSRNFTSVVSFLNNYVKNLQASL